MYENGQGHLTLFCIVFVWLRGRPSPVRSPIQDPWLMYQNRLGPSGGIYYPNFVPCFVVVQLNSKWLASLFNWICETYWTWDTNRHQVWFAVRIAPAQKRVVGSKNRIFLSSFCKGSFDLLLLTWKDSCTAELGLSLSSEHGIFK